MEFRETTKEDLEFAENHSISRGIQKHSPEQIDYCYTLEHEGSPLMIGGFSMINRTTAWCWVDITDESGKNIIRIYRIIKEWIDQFCKDHKLIRLQAYVECDFDEAIRMVEHLGFKKESIMVKFMGDKDAYMFTRVI